MPQYQFPAPLSERRSDERDVFTLVNALRKAFLQLTGGGATGLALFSTVMGRGDQSTNTTGTEGIILSFELPSVIPAFTVNFAGQGSDSVSTATFRLRAGGTYGVANSGTVIATMVSSSTSLSRCETTSSVTGNTSTLIQATIQSSGNGRTAHFVAGSIVFN